MTANTWIVVWDVYEDDVRVQHFASIHGEGTARQRCEALAREGIIATLARVHSVYSPSFTKKDV